MAAPSLASLANAKVPMGLACRTAGFYVPRGADSGSKVHCPWGQLNHPDGGSEAAMRVYSDHAWCFACSEHFTPVKMAARLLDCDYETAAIRLLDTIGYKPASYAQYWQQASAEPPWDYGALAQALKNYCSGVCPDWASRSLDPRVAGYLSRCLGYLGAVTSEETARQWLERAKQVMRNVLT